MGDYLRFAWIVMCFMLSFVYGSHVLDQKDVFLLRLAMLFTVMADFCLIITGYTIAGVLFFCMVQLIYNVRYGSFEHVKVLLLSLPMVLVFTRFLLRLEPLYVAAALYAACFLFSLTAVWKAWKADKYPFPNQYLVSVGMVLFLLCDIHVALYHVGIDYVDQRGSVFVFLIWLFYGPSQLLLSLSGKRFNISSNIFSKKV